MYPSSILLFIFIIGASAEVRYKITWNAHLLKPWNHGSESQDIYYLNNCVNLSPKWTAERESINTHGKCITLYTQPDCKGDSVNFNPMAPDLQFLDTINFEDKAASFRKCNGSSSQPSFNYGTRPRYHFTLHSDRRLSETISIRSGECINVPKEWYQQLHSITYDKNVISLFSDVNCTGMETVLRPQLGKPPSKVTDFKVKSVGLFDLKFKTPCPLCPDFFYKNSTEYKFWLYLFSMYPGEYRRSFEERVKYSLRGSILWDFLFTPNGSILISTQAVKTSAKERNTPAQSSQPGIYADAFQNQFRLFGYLLVSPVGQLGFTRENISALQSLAEAVAQERSNQYNDHDDDNIRDVLQYFRWFRWEPLRQILNRINEYWKDVAPSEKPPTKTTTVAPRNRATSPGRGKCEPVPAEWRNQTNNVVSSEGQCFILFQKKNCQGTKYWAITFNHVGGQNRNEQSQRYNGAVESFRVCDLTFSDSCSLCPILLSVGSKEYQFWMAFFDSYSRANSTQFQAHVMKQKRGFITWDFLGGLNATDQSLGDQYQFAFDHLIRIIYTIQTDRPGKWGFGIENVEKLRLYATQVLAERQEQGKKVRQSWAPGDVATLEQLISKWTLVQNVLNQTLVNWNSDGVAICGLVDSNRPILFNVSVPEMATYGSDPWHAALYRTSRNKVPAFTCGATLISATVLISAAHCFYDETRGEMHNTPSEYEIVVAKFRYNYSIIDSPFQKTHKIKMLVLTDNAYDPAVTETYGSDLILIILETPVAFNSYVRPICLDRDNSVFASSSYDDDAIGRLAGWGVKTNRKSTQSSEGYLNSADLPYISFNSCKGRVQQITHDKFCAGSEDGPGAGYGDGGGGLVFCYQNRYYIRGVASTRDRDLKNFVITFTDLAYYMPWIRKVMP